MLARSPMAATGAESGRRFGHPPYRLDLPSDFTWVEADFPELLAEKAELLSDRRRVAG